jgi:hypothetical protein
MKHIKKISDYSIVGGMGGLLMVGLTGCESMDNGLPSNVPNAGGQNGSFQEASQKQGAFVVIEEVAPKKYTIVDEFPSKETKIILKTLDGKEKILSKEEMDALVKEEAAKIDAGTSELTQEQQVSSGSGGMGLGGIILSSMAGAMLGSYIGNKLFNNQNYQNNRKAGYKSPQTYSKSKNSFNKARKTGAAKKSGYFGNNKKGATQKKMTTKRSGGFFGGSRSSSRGFGG